MQYLKSVFIVDSSYPINTRNERIVDSLNKFLPFINVSVACWNRDNRDIVDKDKKKYIYKSAAKYGNAIRKLYKLYGYYSYLKQINKKEKYDIIIASHWDCLFLCFFLKMKHQTLIYENLDIPTSLNKHVLKVLLCVEKLCLKRTDMIVMASRFYLPLYDFFNGRKLVVENKLPSENCTSINCRSFDKKELVITFLGNIRYADILKNLILAVGNQENIICHIYGDGPDYKDVYSVADRFYNIKMYGRYNYSDVPRIYECSDVVWAVYPSHDYNVRYAISNKYHESLYYGIPAIYAEGTELAQMVIDKGIGFIVNPYSINDIKECVIKLRDQKVSILSEIRAKLENSKSTETENWDVEFMPFVEYIKNTL